MLRTDTLWSLGRLIEHLYTFSGQDVETKASATWQKGALNKQWMYDISYNVITYEKAITAVAGGDVGFTASTTRYTRRLWTLRYLLYLAV